MIYLIITAALISPVVYLLTREIELKVNTEEELYYLKITGLAAIYAKGSDNDFVFDLNFLFFNKKIKLLEEIFKGKSKSIEKERQEKEKPKKKKQKKSLPAEFYYRMFFVILSFLKDLLDSFEVRKFSISFDTGSFPLNAQLYAVIPLLRLMKVDFQPNFNSRFYLDILILNNVCNLLKIILKKGFQTLVLYIKYK